MEKVATADAVALVAAVRVAAKAVEKVAVMRGVVQVVVLAGEETAGAEKAVVDKAEVAVAVGLAEANIRCSCHRRGSRRYHSCPHQRSCSLRHCIHRTRHLPRLHRERSSWQSCPYSR